MALRNIVLWSAPVRSSIPKSFTESAGAGSAICPNNKGWVEDCCGSLRENQRVSNKEEAQVHQGG